MTSQAKIGDAADVHKASGEPLHQAPEIPFVPSLTIRADREDIAFENTCCSPAEQASCCEPSVKADCCVPPTRGRCGCQ